MPAGRLAAVADPFCLRVCVVTGEQARPELARVVPSRPAGRRLGPVPAPSGLLIRAWPKWLAHFTQSGPAPERQQQLERTSARAN